MKKERQESRAQKRHGESLEEDLRRLQEQVFSRRRAMLWLAAGAGVLPLMACGSDTTQRGTTPTTGTTGTGTTDTSTDDTTSDTDSGGTSLESCEVIPEETAGPYPGDGSNGANALALAGIIRQDITSSIGTDTVASGVPLTIEITLVNASSSCAELEGYAVYLWHADRSGNYSMYSSSVKSENYLRGVQEADANGKLSFQSIFPGCYDGRWPHIHFEVYRSTASATNAKNKIATSQLALPASACKLVYAKSEYSSSVKNYSRISLASDNVFSDGSSLQMPTVEGDAESGFTVKLLVAVKA